MLGTSGGLAAASTSCRRATRPRLRWIVPLILVAAVIFPFFASKYLLAVVILGLIYVLLGLGLNIVVGLAGLSTSATWPSTPWRVWPGAGLPVPRPGLLDRPAAGRADRRGGRGDPRLPVLRMHGDYLAIVTLGFGEIIRLVLNNWLSFTGGPNGIGAGLDISAWSSAAGPGWRDADPRVPRHRLQPQHEGSCSSTWCCSGRAAGALHQAPADRMPGAPGRRCARTRSPVARWASTMCW